jgi:hypothetical protein
MELVPQHPHVVGGPGLHGSISRPDGSAQRLLTPQQAALVQRFDPGDDDMDTVGFFIAKFVKQDSICE